MEEKFKCNQMEALIACLIVDLIVLDFFTE